MTMFARGWNRPIDAVELRGWHGQVLLPVGKWEVWDERTNRTGQEEVPR